MANVLTRNYAPPTPAQLVTAFCAGFLAVLIFHQPMLAILHAVGLTPAVPYALRPTAPFGVPELWSLAFWGGVWGILFALLWPSAHTRSRYIGAGLIFGAVLPSLVAWFVVAALKGLPIAGGGRPAAIATALLVNAAWGFGTALMIIGAARLFHIREPVEA